MLIAWREYRNTMYNNIYYVIVHFMATMLPLWQTTYIVPYANNHQQFGCGGGMSVFFRGHATNNSIYVRDCNFAKKKPGWRASL